MDKRVVIISDVVMKFGGAEKVLEALLEIYPNADLMTLFIVPTARKKINNHFPGVTIITSPFQYLINKDRVSKYISIIKVFSWIYWELVDLKKYNLIISSSHSYMSKNVKSGAGTTHLSYIHTPPRYLYDEFNEIGAIKRFPLNWLFWPVRMLLMRIDTAGAKRPGILVVNSENVRKRVMKYYGRDSIIVYPPIAEVACDTKNIDKGYYVCVSRLVRQKGIDLVVKTFASSGKKLLVVGDGDEREVLKRMATKNIKFHFNCNERKKFKIMMGAKALIYTSINEDFGIVPVESLKLGVPIIAHNSGGVTEVVMDGVNGIFFDDRSVIGLKKAIRRFEKLNIQKQACVESVKKFGKEIFKNEIKRLINNDN